jgi:hypothetical protein
MRPTAGGGSSANRAAATDLRAALAFETEATVAGMLDPETTRLMKQGFS